MNVYEILINDHQIVKALFDRLEKMEEDQIDEREEIFQTLNHELSVHALAEEKFFYPLLKTEDEAEDITLEAIEEHKVVKKLLKELNSNGKGTKEWAAKLKVLQENVLHHVKEEEGELFEKAEDILSDEDADRIGQQIDAFKSDQAELEEAS
jgi:hemerythrin superfamily protein